MNLHFEPFDGRSFGFTDVINKATGETVGHIRANGVGSGNFGGIDVSLFGDKYRGSFHRYEECFGFVKGVEAVLRHMHSTAYPKQSKSSAA